jgi:hypothetical protein
VQSAALSKPGLCSLSENYERTALSSSFSRRIDLGLYTFFPKFTTVFVSNRVTYVNMPLETGFCKLWKEQVLTQVNTPAERGTWGSSFIIG